MDVPLQRTESSRAARSITPGRGGDCVRSCSRAPVAAPSTRCASSCRLLCSWPCGACAARRGRRGRGAFARRLDAAAGGPAGLELDSAGRGSTAPRSGASMGPRLVPHAVCRSLCPPVDVAARRVGRRATDRRLAPTPVRAVAGACIHVANTKNQSETYTLVSRGYGDKSCCRWCSWRRLIAACRAAWRLLPRAAPPSPPPRRTAGRSPRLRLSRRADQMCVVPDRDLRHVQLTSRN